MLKLGITGGIGSGKSTVCGIFAQLGVPVYHADERAKWLVDNDPAIRENIIREFGEESFLNGVYNRAYISSIVFKDKDKLDKLNSFIHPAVLQDWEEFCSKQSTTYVVKEAAIMLEAGGREVMDRIALVVSPKELRIKRLIERDQIDRAAIEARMNSQMPEEEKMKLADYVIYNDEEHSLVEQVRDLHQILISSGWMS